MQVFANQKALETYRRARSERKQAILEAQRIEAEHQAFAAKMAAKKVREEIEHQAFAEKQAAKLSCIAYQITCNNPNLTARQVSQVAERIMRYGR